MTFYALKPRFQDLLRPLVVPLPRIGVTANMVTIVAALGSVLVGAVAAWRADSRRVFLIITAVNRVRAGVGEAKYAGSEAL